ncbi:MAG: hypothetical protein EOP83_09685 [Verrucomicrobiaceae bacterium]|nr:MAG: hypothetical protein EOP83_09685 [Verrucomicrobiaceae bacterium]
MRYTRIPVTRTVETFVVIGITKGRPTEQDIAEAIEKTTSPEEWDVVPGSLSHGAPGPMAKAHAEEYHVHVIGSESPSKPSYKARAAEIGVTVVTLRKWRDIHCVDIFDDAAVRSHIGKQRNYIPTLTDRFKTRLSDA